MISDKPRPAVSQMSPERLTCLGNDPSQINPGETREKHPERSAGLQGFFRRSLGIFSRPSAGPAYGSGEMYDLYAIGIAAACFAFAFGLVWLLGRV